MERFTKALVVLSIFLVAFIAREKKRGSTIPKLSGFHTSPGGGQVSTKLKVGLKIKLKEMPET